MGCFEIRDKNANNLLRALSTNDLPMLNDNDSVAMALPFFSSFKLVHISCQGL
jgi:hypothetical protein